MVRNEKLGMCVTGVHIPRVKTVKDIYEDAKRDIDKIPERILGVWSYRLFALMNLTWTYVETIIDLSALMRISEVKAVSRRVRQLKREYDKFRWGCLSQTLIEDETELGECFEEKFTDDFKILFSDIAAEVRKLDLKPDHEQLVIAVQQCLTLVDAVKLYSEWCEDRMREDYGIRPPKHCMIQNEFLEASRLIPEYAGDCYSPDLSIRHEMARTLSNRLHCLEIPPEMFQNVSKC